EVVRKEIKLAVIEAYSQSIISRELIRLQEENVQDLMEQRESVREQVKEGIMASYNLTETEAHLANARFEMVSAENNYRLAKAVLARLMMLTEDFEVVPPEIPPFIHIAQDPGTHPALEALDLRI